MKYSGISLTKMCWFWWWVCILAALHAVLCMWFFLNKSITKRKYNTSTSRSWRLGLWTKKVKLSSHTGSLVLYRIWKKYSNVSSVVFSVEKGGQYCLSIYCAWKLRTTLIKVQDIHLLSKFCCILWRDMPKHTVSGNRLLRNPPVTHHLPPPTSKACPRLGSVLLCPRASQCCKTGSSRRVQREQPVALLVPKTFPPMVGEQNVPQHQQDLLFNFILN